MAATPTTPGTPRITSIKIGDSKTINSPTLINENGYEYGPYYLDKQELIVLKLKFL